MEPQALFQKESMLTPVAAQFANGLMTVTNTMDAPAFTIAAQFFPRAY